MPDKTDTDGQPTMEKLEAEGVSPRRCISYEGLGEYGGNAGNGGDKSSKPKTAKKVPSLSSFGPMRNGGGY